VKVGRGPVTSAGTVRQTRLEAGQGAEQRPDMTKPSPFQYFKSGSVALGVASKDVDEVTRRPESLGRAGMVAPVEGAEALDPRRVG
jgi:hypothetical protein